MAKNRLIKNLRIQRLTVGLLVFILAVICLSPLAPRASAISPSQWNAGHIIDDSVFTNSNSMSVSDIQNFLQSKITNGSCDTNGSRSYTYLYNASTGAVGPNSGGSYVTTTRQVFGQRYDAYYGSNIGATPYVCLPQYVENPTTHQNNLQNPNLSISGGESAAQIILNAAQQYNINPQVLIVTLQKEQGLVTDDWPWVNEYQEAMGYNCPDTPQGCNSADAGFYTQVNDAAWQFRYYLDHPGAFSYWIGNNNIQYNPNSACGSSVVNIQNAATAALYIYTPYQPDQAAVNAGYGSGDSCSTYGNRNFWLYFNDWFGSSVMPYAFKSSTSPIYYYASGYKIQVTSMAVLQDYGISPDSIQTVDQSTVDAVATPSSTSGLSTTLGYMIKSPSDTDADGASVYYMSVGKLYKFTTSQQLSDFGPNFSSSNISYMPLTFIQEFQNQGALSNFIKAPTGAVFDVTGGQKRIIFDYPTYTNLNTSGQITYVSYFGANLFSSGIPLTSGPILVKYVDSEEPYLLTNNNYYGVPTYDDYTCWGFSSTLHTPVYRVADNSYIAPINPLSNLGCLMTDASNNSYLLSNNSKYSVPSSYNLSPTVVNQDVSNMAANLPTASSSLLQYIKGTNSAAVWYLEGGKKLVPTYTDYQLLKLSSSQLTSVDDSSLSSIPTVGVKLGQGQIVKADTSPAVYVVSGNGRILYSTSNDFLAYGNSWSNIETVPQNQLDADYPFGSVTVNRFLYDKPSNGLYLVDVNGCYSLDSSLQASYGQNQSTISSNQSYDSSIFVNLNLPKCAAGSVYVKEPGQSLVYWIDSGTKHPIMTWDALVAKSGTTNPYVVTLSDYTLQTFPTGSSL